jgi:ubiquinone/menaquinone biosynthesis C-methylase UbiE
MGKYAEYDDQARDYDKTRFNDNMGRHLDYLHKKILWSFINYPGNDTVLEVGVGTGRFGTWLAKKGFKVVGVDLSKEMLKKAKEKKELLNVDVGLIMADVHFLPFKKGIFDSCICINVMDHFPDIDAFLRQVKNVIKPDGYFIFNFSNILSPYLPIAVIINSTRQALFRGGRIQSRWFTLREINGMISRNGFDIKEIKGCFIASPLPLGDTLVKLIKIVNLSAENSILKFFAGSPFIKVKSTCQTNNHDKTPLR